MGLFPPRSGLHAARPSPRRPEEQTPARVAETIRMTPHFTTLLLQIGVILVLARALGWIFHRFHQPRVVGEMAAGILLGPSLLGWIPPAAASALVPEGRLEPLRALSQIGVILFIVLVGLGLDARALRGRGGRRRHGLAPPRGRGPSDPRRRAVVSFLDGRAGIPRHHSPAVACGAPGAPRTRSDLPPTRNGDAGPPGADPADHARLRLGDGAARNPCRIRCIPRGRHPPQGARLRRGGLGKAEGPDGGPP